MDKRRVKLKIKRAKTGRPPWISLAAWRLYPHLREEDWEEMFMRYRTELTTTVAVIIKDVVPHMLFYKTYAKWVKYHMEDDNGTMPKNFSRHQLTQYRQSFRVKLDAKYRNNER